MKSVSSKTVLLAAFVGMSAALAACSPQHNTGPAQSSSAREGDSQRSVVTNEENLGSQIPKDQQPRVASNPAVEGQPGAPGTIASPSPRMDRAGSAPQQDTHSIGGGQTSPGAGSGASAGATGSGVGTSSGTGAGQ